MLIQGGAHAADSVDARLFEVIERAGVFLAGARPKVAVHQVPHSRPAT
jgi:hypothetical protein